MNSICECIAIQIYKYNSIGISHNFLWLAWTHYNRFVLFQLLPKMVCYWFVCLFVWPDCNDTWKGVSGAKEEQIVIFSKYKSWGRCTNNFFHLLTIKDGAWGLVLNVIYLNRLWCKIPSIEDNKEWICITLKMSMNENVGLIGHTLLSKWSLPVCREAGHWLNVPLSALKEHGQFSGQGSCEFPALAVVLWALVRVGDSYKSPPLSPPSPPQRPITPLKHSALRFPYWSFPL